MSSGLDQKTDGTACWGPLHLVVFILKERARAGLAKNIFLFGGWGHEFLFVCLFFNFCFGSFKICQFKTNCRGLRSLSEFPNLILDHHSLAHFKRANAEINATEKSYLFFFFFFLFLAKSA